MMMCHEIASELIIRPAAQHEFDFVGGIERELTVEIRPDAMQAAGVSVSQLVTALQAQNLASPVGKVNGAIDERAIRLKGKLETPEDFLSLVVAQRNGRGRIMEPLGLEQPSIPRK